MAEVHKLTRCQNILGHLPITISCVYQFLRLAASLIVAIESESCWDGQTLTYALYPVIINSVLAVCFLALIFKTTYNAKKKIHMKPIDRSITPAAANVKGEINEMLAPSVKSPSGRRSSERRNSSFDSASGRASATDVQYSSDEEEEEEPAFTEFKKWKDITKITCKYTLFFDFALSVIGIVLSSMVLSVTQPTCRVYLLPILLFGIQGFLYLPGVCQFLMSWGFGTIDKYDDKTSKDKFVDV